MALMKDLHKDSYLTNFSVAKMNDPESYIFNEVLPQVPVDNESDYYAVYGDEVFFGKSYDSENFGKVRQMGSKYHREEWNLTTAGQYQCEEYGEERPIDKRKLDRAKKPFNLEKDTTVALTEILAIYRELRAATLLFTAANFTNNTTPGTTWDDSAADIITDKNTAHQTIQKAIGRRANLLTIGQEVKDSIEFHPQITDKVKWTNEVAGGVPEAMLAKFFGVKRLVVGGCIYNSAKDGQDHSGGFIWGKKALFMYQNPAVSTLTITCARAFTTEKFMIEKYWSDDLRSLIIRGREVMDEVLVSELAGYIYDSVVA